MRIEDAQRDVREAFDGGSVGQLVSGLLWLTSAVLSEWSSASAGMTVLLVGGFFIFPLTLLGLRMTGRPGGLPPDHPMNPLGMQVALTLPLVLPLVGAAALHRLEWFYPAFMIALGAHYLPFVFLYGMRMFGGLAAALVGTGMFLGLSGPGSFATGAWLTAGMLLAFAALARTVMAREWTLPRGPRSASR